MSVNTRETRDKAVEAIEDLDTTLENDGPLTDEEFQDAVGSFASALLWGMVYLGDAIREAGS